MQINGEKDYILLVSIICVLFELLCVCFFPLKNVTLKKKAKKYRK